MEKPVFKPSPQIFSSVFVDKKEENIVSNNEEEHVTEIKKEQKPFFQGLKKPDAATKPVSS